MWFHELSFHSNFNNCHYTLLLSAAFNNGETEMRKSAGDGDFLSKYICTGRICGLFTCGYIQHRNTVKVKLHIVRLIFQYFRALTNSRIRTALHSSLPDPLPSDLKRSDGCEQSIVHLRRIISVTYEKEGYKPFVQMQYVSTR